MTPEFHAFVAELFSAFGPVEIRPTFNFDGLYPRGVILGLVSGQRIYLKTDTTSRGAFDNERMGPMRYTSRDGAEVAMSYYELPPRLYDDPEEAADWARQAFDAALRSSTTKRKARKRERAKSRRTARRSQP
jgi:DNA transformation protein